MYLHPQTPHAESTTHGAARARESRRDTAAAASGHRRTPHVAPLHRARHLLHRRHHCHHRPHHPHHLRRHCPLCCQ
ncbi:unnamed protein product [Closterium sp. NIES-53]